MTCKWADDSQRLILDNFDTIQDSPSKIYCEAVPFSPSSSWLHKWYSPELLQGVMVVKGLQVGWGTCSRTVLFDYIPYALVCWNNLIVSGSYSNIIILDATTGTHTSTLSGHTDFVISFAFSSDGASLVSGSQDKTVRLWDIQTGGVIRIFYGHTEWVASVSISSDQTTIASGSNDGTIRLWKVQTGECSCVADEHNGWIQSVQFSPKNPQRLISVSSNGTAQWWDTNGHRVGPAHGCSSATHSSDGTHFVLWSGGGNGTVQNYDSGVIIAKIQAPGSTIHCCCFSPNKKYVAGAGDNTIYIWDITSSDPHPIKTFVGHAQDVTSIVFSSTLISSSRDRSIRFWQIDPSFTNMGTADSESKPLVSASITFISVQAKDHIAISSDEAGLVRAWDISTGLCKASTQTSVRPPNWRDAQLIGGGFLLVWCTSKEIYIWDTKKGGQPKRVVPRSNFSTAIVRISGDGSKFFLLDSEYIQALSTQTGGVVGKVKLQGKPFGDLIIDGLRVWIDHKHSTPEGWDFGAPGSSPIRLSNKLLPSPWLDFIHTTLPSRVKNKATGKEIFQFPRRYGRFTKARCNGQYLIVGYKSGELLILDFGQMFPQ